MNSSLSRGYRGGETTEGPDADQWRVGVAAGHGPHTSPSHTVRDAVTCSAVQVAKCNTDIFVMAGA